MFIQFEDALVRYITNMTVWCVVSCVAVSGGQYEAISCVLRHCCCKTWAERCTASDIFKGRHDFASQLILNIYVCMYMQGCAIENVYIHTEWTGGCAGNDPCLIPQPSGLHYWQVCVSAKVWGSDIFGMAQDAHYTHFSPMPIELPQGQNSAKQMQRRVVRKNLRFWWITFERQPGTELMNTHHERAGLILLCAWMKVYLHAQCRSTKERTLTKQVNFEPHFFSSISSSKNRSCGNTLWNNNNKKHLQSCTCTYHVL